MALAPKWRAFTKALGKRRSTMISIVCKKEQVEAATAFAEALERSGYARPSVTCSAGAGAVGRQVVILWHPTPEEAIVVAKEAEEANPTAYQLVLTHVFLPRELPLGEHRLLANSEVRLRSDLAQVSEVLS